MSASDPRFASDPSDFEIDRSQFDTSLNKEGLDELSSSSPAARAAVPDEAITLPPEETPRPRPVPPRAAPARPDGPPLDPEAREREESRIRRKKTFLTFLSVYIFMLGAAGLITALNVIEDETARSLYTPLGALVFCLLWIGFVIYVARLGKKG